MLQKADELDKKDEVQLLSRQEIDLKQSIKERLAHFLIQEELKWFQRAKTTEILQVLSSRG